METRFCHHVVSDDLIMLVGLDLFNADVLQDILAFLNLIMWHICMYGHMWCWNTCKIVTLWDHCLKFYQNLDYEVINLL